MAHDGDVSRRRFLQTAAGGTAVTAATGLATAQEGTETGTNTTATNTTSANMTAGNTTSSGGGGGGGSKPAGPPDLGGYLDGANNYEGSVVDETGSANVTVDVGAGDGLAFGPAAVHVDNGATVTWEWTGEGGAHNVVAEDETFNSGDPASEGPFEYTFEEDGIYTYYCSPHKSSGMLGAVVVGTNYPTKSTGGSSGGPSALPESVKQIGIAASVVMTSTLGLAYMFIKYGGDYETPE